MHLGIDARTLCEPEPTGVSRYALEVISHMLRQNEDLEVSFFVSGTRAKEHAEKLRKIFPGPNIQIITRQIPNKLLRLGFFTKTVAIDQLAPKPDVWFFPGFKPAHIKKKPYVITVHDLSFEHYPDFWSRKWKWSHATNRSKTIAQNAAHIIAVSDYTAQDVMHTYHIPKEHVSTIYPGIHPVKIHERERDPFSVLMVSSIEPRKNMEAAVRAIASLRTKNEFKNLRLTIVGPQGWKTERMVGELKKMQWVTLAGFVEDQELSELYGAAGVFMYPSFFEGFGFPPLEAMAYGVPVIASHAASLPEVLGEAAQYVNPYDWKELAAVLEEVIGDKTLRKQMSEKGFEQIKRYRWDRCAQDTYSILSSL